MQFEIQCEMADGKGNTSWVTYDWAHTEEEARKKVDVLRSEKRNARWYDLERDRKKKERQRREYEDEE